MDIISWIWNGYSSLTYNLPSTVFSFLLRANLLLLCPVIAAYIGFSQIGRSHRLQAILMVIGALVAISIPLEWLTVPSAWRPWTIIILLAGCWYLPVIFSFLAHRELGTQARVLRATRITLVLLLVLNLIFFGGQQ
jgi:hypothetical protein